MADAAAGSGYGDLALTSLMVLALVCGLAWAAVRLLGRWVEGRRVGGGVAIVGRVPLEPRRALYVVEAGGRTLLLGSSEMGLSLIAELDAASVATAEPEWPRGGWVASLGGAFERVFASKRESPGGGS